MLLNKLASCGFIKFALTGRISGAIVVSTYGAISHARVWLETTANEWPFSGFVFELQCLNVSLRFNFSRVTLPPCGHSRKFETAGALF